MSLQEGVKGGHGRIHLIHKPHIQPTGPAQGTGGASGMSLQMRERGDVCKPEPEVCKWILRHRGGIRNVSAVAREGWRGSMAPCRGQCCARRSYVRLIKDPLPPQQHHRLSVLLP